MAKPQKENGYTPIANELLEKLARVSLSPNQWQVLMVIFRKTYGFHKKVDYIANFQIGELTGLGKTVVSRVLHNLADRNLITRKKKIIGFQKDWEKWQQLAVLITLASKLAEQSTSEVINTANQSKQDSQPKLAEQSTKVSSSEDTQKIKETIQKKLYKRKIAIPDFIDKGLWDNFLEMRKKMRKPPTDKAVSLLLEDLEKYKAAGDDPNEVLKQSIKNNWMGVFPVKGGSYGAHRQGSTKLPPRDGYTKPRPNPELDKLVEQRRAADKLAGHNQPE